MNPSTISIAGYVTGFPASLPYSPRKPGRESALGRLGTELELTRVDSSSSFSACLQVTHATTERRGQLHSRCSGRGICPSYKVSLVNVTALCRRVVHDKGHLPQMVDLADAAADPVAGSFVVPAGQRQARIRFGPEPSPLKR